MFLKNRRSRMTRQCIPVEERGARAQKSFGSGKGICREGHPLRIATSEGIALEHDKAEQSRETKCVICTFRLEK
jgi:hypothetical protein